MDVNTLRENLAKYGQEHLLAFWEELDEPSRDQLYSELMDLDLEHVTRSFKRCLQFAEDEGKKLDDQMSPLPSHICGSILTATNKEKSDYENLAFEQIVEGKMAVLLLAGGQGTRLGVSYPKGMYEVGLLSGKSLFQLQAERLLKLQRLAEERTGKVCKQGICWYIMTSEGTSNPTIEFFESHNFFGLDPENVVVFQQGTLPCFSFKGKMLLASKYELQRAPDGNGGLYRALRREGILEDMRERGVTFVQLYCVDNILVRVGDPIFAGYCLSKGADCANKVVPKGFPTEAVGITCKVDGKYQVVEYSEITEQAAESREDDGSLTFSAANVCIHFFTRDFLERVVAEHEPELIHHVAKKKIPFVDPDTGKVVSPDKPNGIKMEKFVFDVFRFADSDKFAVWECVREDEFAPLKNAEGASDFTPTHCRNALYALHQKFLLSAGAKLVDQDGCPTPLMASPAAAKDTNNNNNNNIEDKSPVYACEISPLVSYAGEGLEQLVKNKVVEVPVNLNDQN